MDERLFYVKCLEEFHDIAAQKGQARKGVMFCQDLMPMGEKAVTSYYADPILAAEFAADATQYYYAVSCFCLQCGILFAGLYDTNPLALTDGYVDSVTGVDPWQFAESFVNERLDMDLEGLNSFAISIFNSWIDLVEPHYEEADASKYIYYATLAFFQLGVSMMAATEGKGVV